MDSLQAKRANAISFQLRLRDKTQRGIKTTNPTGFLSGLSPSTAFRRITFQVKARGSPLHVLDRGHYLASDFRDFHGSINLALAVLLKV